MHKDVRTALLEILKSPIFLQLFPFIVLFGAPIVVVLFVSTVRAMVFDGWSLWPFGSSSPSSSASSGSSSDRRKERKLRKHRNSNVAEQGASSEPRCTLSTYDVSLDSNSIIGNGSYYPGLVNISGTYCFMNSTIQVYTPLCAFVVF
jgi:ubiquitin carboxyl-terminal hydrolase 1